MVKISFYDPDEERPSPRMKGKEKSGFTMDWVGELGWKSDAFGKKEAGLADFEDERQEINLFFIKRRRFGVVIGEHGMGKSTLFRWLEKELGQYKELDTHLVSARSLGSDEALCRVIADRYRGMFGRGKALDRTELLELLSGKVKRHFVLLVDEAEALDEAMKETINMLSQTESSILLATAEPVSGMPKDELELGLAKRTPEQYEKILGDRIARSGGHGIHPFTRRVIERIGEDTETTQEFLELARETAINIALKRVAIDGAVDAEDLAEQEEAKAERKKGKGRKKTQPEAKDTRSTKKRQYDELIESLTEGME